MSAPSFAATPEPPYYAVVFSSRRTDEDRDYAAVADRMVELAAKVAAPGEGADRRLRSGPLPPQPVAVFAAVAEAVERARAVRLVASGANAASHDKASCGRPSATA